MKISASLVLFHNDPKQFGLAILSFINGCDGKMVVMDNSSEPLSHELFSHPRVHYIYTRENLGFGKAHNRAIGVLAADSDLHLLLNPDITFETNVLSELVSFLKTNSDVGAVMPRINYPDGKLQHLCKLLPTPLDLISRRFIPSKHIRTIVNRRYEMHHIKQNMASCVPNLSGCFLLIRTELLKSIKGFDERFFMYMEDVDLIRRIGDLAKTIYFPMVHVVHAYEKGSYRISRLLFYHLHSAILYFFKWGWLFDRTRSERNHIAKRFLSINKDGRSPEC